MGAGPHDDDAPALHRYRFGTAEFDQARQTLRVDGVEVDTEPRPLQVLERLLLAPGEVITRDELFDTVWAGRPTVDNVLANAVAKLRRVLGEANAALIQTVPRVGYRLTGPVERVAEGRRSHAALRLVAGEPVPARPHWLLDRRLDAHGATEVWRARHAKTHETRIFKFAGDGQQLAALKREVTLYRLLRESLGERADIVRLVDWQFDAPPWFIECEDAGRNLADWAAEQLAATDRAGRIDLLARVAEAVSAAHGVGVLHKDLKPSNVLVQEGADGLQVRLGDFGSGRLLDPARLAALGITAQGLTLTQLPGPDTAGTLAYLAPEVLAGQPPTTRSDVYALGLMLYQLLANDLQRPLLPGWERDVDDDLLREDIAAAAERDPARRLASADALVERLRGLEARREARAARLRQDAEAAAARAQWLRARARRPFVVAAVVLLASGLGVSFWQYRRAEQAARHAADEAAVAQAVNRFVTDDLIGGAQPSTSGKAGTTMIEAAHAAIGHVDEKQLPPRIRAALRKTLQITLSELSDRQEAVAQGRLALQALAEDGDTDLVNAAETRAWLASDLAQTGALDEAKVHLQWLAAHEAALLQAAPEVALRYYQAQSITLGMGSQNREAAVFDQKAFALARRLPNVRPGLLDQLQFNLADGLIETGQPAQAEASLRELLARQAARLGADHEHTLYTRVLLAHALVRQRRIDEAAAIIGPAVAGLARTLGPEAKRTLMAGTVQAAIDMQRGDLAAAATRFQALHRAFAQRDGAASPMAISMLDGQATALLRAGDARRAEPLLRRALATAHEAFGAADNPLLQKLRFGLADCLLVQAAASTEAAALLDHLQPASLEQADPLVDWPSRLADVRGRLVAGTGVSRP